MFVLSLALVSFMSPSSNKATTTENGNRILCSESNLISNFNTVSGTVSVYVLDETIMVKFKTSKNRSLNKTHLYVGSIEALPKTENGNPDLQLFPHKGKHSESTTIVTYDIDVNTLPSGKIAIAAFSEVTGITRNTAWAGDLAYGGPSNAKYYEFDLNACR